MRISHHRLTKSSKEMQPFLFLISVIVGLERRKTLKVGGYDVFCLYKDGVVGIFSNRSLVLAVSSSVRLICRLFYPGESTNRRGLPPAPLWLSRKLDKNCCR